MENYLKERIIHLKKCEVDYFNQQYDYCQGHPLRKQMRDFSNEFHARRDECELLLKFLNEVKRLPKWYGLFGLFRFKRD